MMLVSAMSVVSGLEAATRLTTNSGVDVPKATTVRPITKLDTLKRFANPVAPSTRK